jgi:HEAT repeat protein
MPPSPQTESLTGRALRQRVFHLLQSTTPPDQIPSALHPVPLRRVINPLFSFLFYKDKRIKWAAVKAMGRVVARLADEDMESARVIMRRLMWNLNDESGGIGWGSPEAMGEILASHEGLAREYAPLLISYAREDGNFQENEIMQRGVLWGIGRLSSAFPPLVKDASLFIIPFLRSPDAAVRGHAAWVCGILGEEAARPGLSELTGDEEEIEMYLDGGLKVHKVKDLAQTALTRLDKQFRR